MAKRPNILVITSDQYRYPRFSYGPEAGFDDGLKRILGFHEDLGADNEFLKFFPGLLRLRDNAVVLNNHTIAASACTPSRATIYTGQYGTKTGVTQTDGLFKNGDDPDFPWLKADSIPTLGSWLREAGYATHYFGKWHVSNPPDHSLDAFGFDNWEESYPEPHGAQINNLGLYRDAGFTDAVANFLGRMGLALDYNRVVAEAAAADPNAPAPSPDDVKPWFAVASFVNPHDIATYPAVIAQAFPAQPETPPLPNGNPAKNQSIFGPVLMPLPGEESLLPQAGTHTIPLNPNDFPRHCAEAAPTQDESLADKPSCQHDYSYKMGLALASKTGFNVAETVTGDGNSALAVELALKSTIPFQLAPNPTQECLDFIRLYGFLHSTVDAHIDRVLEALEESGQADDTIVIFLTDHGEYAAAHGMMMEKWHTAYQEILHVPVVVRFPKGEAPLRQIDALTSHIDILPTILGLADIGQEERERIAGRLSQRHTVPPLPGVDLAPLLRGETDTVIEPDGSPRRGVLFITDDEITAPIKAPVGADNPWGQKSLEEYDVYEKTVAAVRDGKHGKGPVPTLATGSVRQPNHVRCVRTQDWKLARYIDPSGVAAQEWEMYDLKNDPNEITNLVEVTVSPPRARADLPHSAAVQQTVDELAKLLEELERRDL